MKIDKLLKDKREEILQVASKHGAYSVRIFGSVARGEANEDSDIDILINVKENHSRWFPGSLLADLEDLLGCKVNILTERSLHELIGERILKEAIPL